MSQAYDFARFRWPHIAFARELDGVCSVGYVDWNRRRYVHVGSGSTFAAAVANARDELRRAG